MTQATGKHRLSRRARIALMVVGMLLGGGLYVLLGQRQEPTDEQKLYRLVSEAQKAVAQHNTTGLTRLISDDYQDRSGYTREQLVPMIASWMRGGEQYEVQPEIKQMTVRGDFADMVLDVRLRYGGAQQYTEPYRIKVTLQREGRPWKVIAAEGWGEAQGDVMGGGESG
ncbi:MAG: hypothetical protein ABFD96_09375 [Armatimonadia bacterium]